MSLLKNEIIKLLEEKRTKYNNYNHESIMHQLKQFNACCQFYKKNMTTLSQKNSMYHKRLTAQKNLKKISELSFSVLILYYFCMNIIKLISKSYLELISKL